jgi:hypothetical protein
LLRVSPWLREKLNENRLAHALFDTDGFRRHIEAAYTRMWELWQHGEAPRSFTVEPAPPNRSALCLHIGKILAKVPCARLGGGIDGEE